MRVESINQRKNGGWLHKLRESRDWQPHRFNGNGALTQIGKPQDKQPSTAQKFVTADEAIANLEQRLGPSAGRWPYHNTAGDAVGVVVRFETAKGKTIRPISRDERGRWSQTGMPEPRPLYNLPEILDADLVFVVEGENCAEAMRSIGFVATTSPHGSSAADTADWTPLAGKQVVILPDFDAAGDKYAANVRSQLNVSPSTVVRIVKLDSHIDGSPMQEKGDIVDWIEGHGDSAEPEVIAANLLAIVEAIEPEAIDPENPPEPLLRWAPFPVDALPEPLSPFVKSVARSVQVDNAMVALPLLCATAAAIGASRSISLREDWQEPCILWGALVAPSGEGKTPAASKVLSAARQRDADAQELNRERQTEYEEKLREFEIDRKAYDKQRLGKTSTEDIGPPPVEPAAPKLPRFTVSDITVERLKEILADSPRGVLMIRDELAGMLGGFDKYSGGRGGSERSTYLSFHNAEPDQNDRKIDNRKNVTLKDPHLSIYGGIQPDLLHNVLSNDDLAAGLPARFLFAMPPSTRKTWGTPTIPTKHREDVAKMFGNLYAIGVTTSWSPDPLADEGEDLEHATLPLTTEADRRFGEFYEESNSERSDLQGPSQAAWAKLVAYCGRLALVVQLIRDPDSTDVDDYSVERAIVLTKWFGNEALRIYSLRTETEEDRELRELVALIQGKGRRITVRELARGPREYRKAGVAESALQRLVKAGLGTWQVLSTGTNQKRVFTLGDTGDGDRFA